MELIQKIIHALTQVHPPHIMVVHFPVGLTGGALFFLILAIIFKKEIFEKIAFANISLAALSTIVAAGMGIRDNIHFYNGLAANHITKIILASSLFLITTLAAYARWKNPDLFHMRISKVFYRLAYFVSFGIAIVLGFLGGVIVYGF